MNRSMTGTYVYEPGQGLVKISPPGFVPPLARMVYVPKGDVPHYDPSARTRFESKAQKRAWLKRHHLREGGIIRPDTRVEGHFKNRSRPSLEQQRNRLRRQDYIMQQGGTQGLLNRLQQQEAHV